MFIGTQNQFNRQGAECKIEMTQNQVYGARLQEGGGDGTRDITMQANLVYGVNEGSSGKNPEADDSYEYI